MEAKEWPTAEPLLVMEVLPASSPAPPSFSFTPLYYLTLGQHTFLKTILAAVVDFLTILLPILSLLCVFVVPSHLSLHPNMSSVSSPWYPCFSLSSKVPDCFNSVSSVHLQLSACLLPASRDPNQVKKFHSECPPPPP